MSIPYGRQHVVLQGELSYDSQPALCQLLHISSDSSSDEQLMHPPEIQSLL